MKKILLFNFYNGVLYRGIPIYSSNLKIGLEKEGCEVNEWKCPNALNKMPRFLLDLLFVFSEQILMPLICFLDVMIRLFILIIHVLFYPL